jgi:hypothetical protein
MAPVQRVPRVSREADRPLADEQERKRRRAAEQQAHGERRGEDEDDEGRPRIDVRA